MKAVIWTIDDCIYCNYVKSLLEKNNIEYQERKINGWEDKDFIEAVPNATYVPQIFIDDILIGGVLDLKKFLKNNLSKEIQ